MRAERATPVHSRAWPGCEFVVISSPRVRMSCAVRRPRPAQTARRSRRRIADRGSSSRVCSPIFGGSRRTPRRWPSIVIGNSVVLTVWPGLARRRAAARRRARRWRAGAGRRRGPRAGGSAQTAGPRSRTARRARRPALRQPLAQRRQQRRAHADALVVGGERRVGLEVGEAQRVAEREPLRVADRGEEDLLAVLHREHVVDRPRIVARGHRRRVLAGHRVLQHVLAHQEHVVLEQRRLHLHAPAGDAALDQRAERADRAEQAAHDVVDAGAGAQRIAGTAGHVGEAAHHLHDFVERGAVLVRAGQEALVAHVDDARIRPPRAPRSRGRTCPSCPA